MPVFVMASLLAGSPVFVLAGLAILGWAEVGSTLVGIGVVAATALGFAALWTRDLELLIERVRLVGSDPPDPAPAETTGPNLMEPLGREIDRLSRRLAIRAALIERHRRADTLILERLPDPLIVLSADRTVRRANAAASAAFGDDMPAVLRHPDLRGAIDRALSQGVSQVAELSLPVPVPRDVHATVVPMDPPLADGGQAVVVLSDRTRERVVERMRADFVANVSHELRTPLASLIGFTETLRGPAADDPPAQQRFLKIMAEQGARMNRLIDDLLSLSRIELTEHQVPSERVDLADLVPRLVAGLEPRLAERKVQLAMQLAADLPLIIGDTDQMAQVLQNLLDNAVKYGREGGTVELVVRVAEGAPRWPARPGVSISVTDQGAGIPPEHLPRLTERFYRVDKGRSRAVGGTGLGLAIVKHIVNRHRGQISIESKVGVGTTVSVWLPLQQAATRMADAD
jgi:two-component system, OmpR family, phosphate regulon sensor histidine kinase PhoR